MRSLWLLLLVSLTATAAEVPYAAKKYRFELTRGAQMVWGMDAPVATFASQITQESAWRENAQSPYASGLAQFTPDTARWIAGAYPAELSGADPFNPTWAIRALLRYDKHLWDRVTAVGPCNRMAMVMSAYNGGLGWLRRDIRYATDSGANPNRWWKHVEHYSNRAAWAFKENRDYPRKILVKWEPVFIAAGWGIGVCNG